MCARAYATSSLGTRNGYLSYRLADWFVDFLLDKVDRH